MNNQIGLPLEFKLFMKKKHVGYMRFYMTIGHYLLREFRGIDWDSWHSCLEREIKFDELRQNTGYKIKNRKVYFGDKLKDGNGPWNILKVEISEDGEIVAANNMFGCFAKDFKIMELTNDTP